MSPESLNNSPAEPPIEVDLDGRFFTEEVVLKTCYWYARDFHFDLRSGAEGSTVVALWPKDPTSHTENLRGSFIASATDFTLRERIEARTASVRDILLAKAFAESGILEDHPQGIFVDTVEQQKPDGLFTILTNG